MKTHELKLDDKYFDEVKSGKKNFEIRKNDRNFQVGDILELRRWDGVYVKGDLMNVRKQEADTIKVKILEMMSWDQLSEPDDEKSMFSFETVNSQIQQVLKDYFKADHLPKGFAILGIEVVK